MERLTGFDANSRLVINEEEKLLSSKGFISERATQEIMHHLAERLCEYEEMEEKGNLMKFPCKIGDTVYLKACCECVTLIQDFSTGVSECPFEYDCEFEECDDRRERVFKTTVDSIFNNGSGWCMYLKGLSVEVYLEDFGRTVFHTQEEAEG